MIPRFNYCCILIWMKGTINRLSGKLGLPPEEISNIYKAYWKFIKETIEGLPLKEDLDEESFHKLRTNFNIPKLGKLHCTYPKYKTAKTINKKLKNAEYNKGKTAG